MLLTAQQRLIEDLCVQRSWPFVVVSGDCTFASADFCTLIQATAAKVNADHFKNRHAAGLCLMNAMAPRLRKTHPH
jgi:hypothetical protein